MNIGADIQVLALVCVANGAPVIAKRLLGSTGAIPLDGGLKLKDGQRLFGPSKTLRGIGFAVASASIVGPLVGVSVAVSAILAAAAMIGDLMSSFIKRRFKMETSTMALGLDQIPESLLPSLLAMMFFSLTFLDVIIIVTIFLCAELLMSTLLFALGIRDRPY